MDAIEKLALLANINHEECAIAHGPTPKESAVNYLCIPMGVTDGAISDQSETYTVPICQSCINHLYSQEWSLIYCLECCESGWIRPRWDIYTGKHMPIILSCGCPHCSESSRLIQVPCEMGDSVEQ